MKYLNITILILIIVAVCLKIYSINSATSLASDSVSVRELQEQIANLQEQNTIAEAKVLELSSFNHVASRAGELGFIEGDKYITLQENNNVALSR